MLKLARIFLKVVELGSFSKAAKVLNMAPSSVTRAIDNLEHELNSELFKRSTRQLLLTDKGHFFLEGASNLVSDCDSLLMSMAESSKEPEGNLRISVFESFGRLIVCPIIPDFLKKYPKITIEVELENKVLDLSAENIDLAIRIGTPKDSSLKFRNIIPNHTFVCASPDYLSTTATIEQPEDLSLHNCLVLNQERQRTYWHFKKSRRNVKALVSGNLKSKGGTPLLEAALCGLGVAQLSNWIVSDYVKSGLLVVCLRDWEPLLNEQSSGSVYGVYKQGIYKNPNIRLFLDYLVEKTHNKLLQRTW
ncbi:LysR family transcriptional regulator [Neptunomonas antarctica]|uniref:DNA-binding transcriptional regulator, LysR family n=1 Tax=Neptunomonas antarctica TaxID=619304 RepID=A0A1N7NY41_9GAMM|nr:LysR family transcriptional regulator [Neptunomonas antarctica]SIT03267.1 DNA-binding transcriptional regulator, LysR family [Neptunomonas antarctica]